jgi:uncharacterized protein (DUF924 family)
MVDDLRELVALLSGPSPGEDWAPANWVDNVLGFWFGELGPAAWFKKRDETDALIRERFSKLYAALARREPDAFLDTPRRALAATIVLDQFPRNMFRGHRQAFATDPLARAIAAEAVDKDFDADMTTDECAFLYLPFEHSEDLADQHRAVELISGLGDDQYTRYAIAHRDVIERFGRFPHRNAVLGRTSTPAEEDYLAQPDSGF